MRIYTKDFFISKLRKSDQQEKPKGSVTTMPKKSSNESKEKRSLHPIWKGHISFGLISIPVSLYSAEQQSEDLKFHLIDSRNNSRIHNQRVNDVTGEEVPWDRIVKGYEYDEEGNYVLLNEADFKKADMKASETVLVEAFVPTESVNIMYYEKPYFLVPEKKAERAYVLLRETLKKTKLIGIARVVIRTREYVAALLPLGKAIVLNLLRYNYELRKENDFTDLPAQNVKDIKLSPKEIEMAETFVNSMKGTFEPDQYKDEYKDRLFNWIQKKAKSGGKTKVEEAPVEEGTTTATEGVDLMELLRKSIEQQGNSPTKPDKNKQRRHQPSP
jgi:DNA end-binding protein Ku